MDVGLVSENRLWGVIPQGPANEGFFVPNFRIRRSGAINAAAGWIATSGAKWAELPDSPRFDKADAPM